MVQTIVNLDNDENMFLNIFKAKRGIRSKSSAIKEIIREYQKEHSENKCKEYKLDSVTKSNLNILKEDWLSEEDESSYAHLKNLVKR